MNPRPEFPHKAIRRSIEDEISRLIELLDAMDGDADLEDSGDDEAEPLEPYLAGALSDLEHDDGEYDAALWIWGGQGR